MKKIYIISGIILSISLILSALYFIVLQPSSNTPPQQDTLAEEQSVQKVEREETPAPQINEETQRQLDQINQMFEKNISHYHEKIETHLKKYKSDVSQEEFILVKNILENATDISDFQSKLEQDLNIRMLSADARALMKIQNIEKISLEDKKLRLENLTKQTQQKINSNNEEIFQLIISETLKEYSSMGNTSRDKVTQTILAQIEEQDNFYEASLESKGKLLERFIMLSLNRHSGLSQEMRTELKEKILTDIAAQNLISLDQEEDSDEQSFFFPLDFISSAHATSPDNYYDLLAESIRDLSGQPELTDIQKQVLRLQIEILIDSLLTSGIQNEIAYTNNEIFETEYETVKDANLILLEEFLLLKETLSGADGVISLDDIQAFGLGNYIDDSEDISGLSPIAYVSSKNGHIMVTNLAGSNFLGQENTPLYPGYRVETYLGAEATLVFIDESVLRLEANTAVNISGESSDIVVGVESGNIWTRVVKPLLTGDRFTIEGNGTSLGVRGTSLYLSLETNSVQVIDSYNPSGEENIDVTGDSLTIIQAGQDESKVSILSSNPKLGRYIREDVSYLALLKDDRERGFFANPLGQNYSGEDFIQKLTGEISVSVPDAALASYVFENIEIQNLTATPENIFELSVKDRLISKIRNDNQNGNINTKISAVAALDFEPLLNSLGNTRALQNTLDFGIEQEILTSLDFTPSQLENIFTSYNLPEKINEKEILLEAAQQLKKITNAGNSIVKGDFTLTGSMLESGKNITVDWQSSNENIIKITGDSAERELPLNQSGDVILAATLTLGNQSIEQDISFTALERELSDDEKLEKAAYHLGEYLDSTLNGNIYFNPATPETLLPGESYFLLNDNIAPDIKFIVQDPITSSNGNFIAPNYNDFTTQENETIRTKTYNNIQAVLTYKLKTYTGSYNNIKIRNQACDGKDLLLGTGNDAVCYQLLASAEYNEAGKYNLVLEDGPNIVASVGNGVKNNKLSLKDTSRGINELSRTGSLVEVGGEKGIYLDNEGSDDYLSYDLSSLNLGDDWAIEMSVRGEDLRRGGEFTLFSTAKYRNIFFQQDNINKLWSIYETDNKEKTGIPNFNGYQNIVYTKNKIFIHSNSYSIDHIPDKLTNINIGNYQNKKQWNGIINYIKIYKKD